MIDDVSWLLMTSKLVLRSREQAPSTRYSAEQKSVQRFVVIFVPEFRGHKYSLGYFIVTCKKNKLHQIYFVVLLFQEDYHKKITDYRLNE